jgi:hypothetical protein
MKASFAFITTMLLTVGTAAFVVQQALLSGPSTYVQGTRAAQVAQEELRQNDLVLVALVSKIDRANSRVFLETEIGSLQAAASSEVLRDLKEGDVITIVVSEDESTQVSI